MAAGIGPVELRSCWCCGIALMHDGRCTLCDLESLVSPPHECLRWGVVPGDEHGCEPEWHPIGARHEVAGPLNAG